MVLIHDVNINCEDTAHVTVQIVAAILLIVIGIGEAVVSTRSCAFDRLKGAQ